MQRKVLTPNEFDSLAAVARRLNEFERPFITVTKPFRGNFTRKTLNALLALLANPRPRSRSLREVPQRSRCAHGTGR